MDARYFDARHLLGVMALQSGHYGEAARHLRQAVELAPNEAQAHGNLATALRMADHPGQAEAPARRAVELAPTHPALLGNLGHILVDMGRPKEAVPWFRKALEQAPGDPRCRYDLGRALNRAKEFVEAEELLRAAMAARAGDRDTAVELGLAIAGQHRHDEAIDWYKHWIERDPDAFGAHYNLGQICAEQEQHETALQAFSEAARLAPNDPQAQGHLALEYEQVNRLEEAERLARRALRKRGPNMPAHLALARCLRRRGETAAALECLEKVGQTRQGWSPGAVWNERARLYESLGRYAEAWQAIEKCNEISRENGTADPEKYREIVSGYEETFQPATVSGWPDLGDPSQALGFTPVFHMGFPRSGTTLTDQMLAAHSGIDVLEEKAPLDVVRQVFKQAGLEYPQGLPDMDTGLRDKARAAYRQTVENLLGKTPASVVVDKMPLYTTQVGLIVRLFPEARIVFSLRHPYDVCLSCLIQNFADNPGMANFRDKASTFSLYTRVMSLWQRYRQLFPSMTAFENRYEDLVADPEQAARRLAEFCGLDFEEVMLETAAQARSSVRIRTASYHQVANPISQSAVARWRHYLPFLRPEVTTLDPFVEAFGYPPVEEVEAAQGSEARA